ncbi:anti-sigma factor family protein [Phosphitispora sp. TUW77]|uniref:anti-sigma factor family protein n=1 Tax=Phosphitispora sp. TUW77 TaxID=3152361 RepID=UPI003AB183DB
MKCREWKKKIPHYLAGEMPGDEYAAFEDHLEGCRYCQEEVDSFRVLNILIDAARLDVPEIDLTASIMSQVNLENRQSKSCCRNVGVLKDLVTAAAAALILFWFSGPALSGGEFPVAAKRVIKVSGTVGGAFQSYVDFSVSTTNKLSASMKQIGVIELKGDE